MTALTLMRRAPRVRFPHLSLPESWTVARRARRYANALVELEGIDHRLAEDLMYARLRNAS